MRRSNHEYPNHATPRSHDLAPIPGCIPPLITGFLKLSNFVRKILIA